MKKNSEIIQATATVLRRLRLDSGFSQEELAAKAEVSRSMIDKSERRERLPSLDVLIKLANALDTKSSDIMKLIELELEK